MQDGIKIVLVDYENQFLFEHLIPDGIDVIYAKENMVVLGVLSEENKALGVGIFREINHHMELIWIYVVPEARGRNLGTAMMNRMISVVESSDYVVGLFADYMTGEYLELDSIMEKLRFEREEQNLGSYRFLLKDASILRMVKKNTMQHVFSLEECTDSMKRLFSNKLWHEKEVYPIEIPIRWENYEKELSCAYVVNGEIKSVLLMEKEDAALNIAFAYAGEYPQMYPYLLGYAFHTAEKNYSLEETEITVTPLTEKSEKILTKIVPAAKKVYVIHAMKTFG